MGASIARRGNKYGVKVQPRAVVSGAGDLHEAGVRKELAQLERGGSRTSRVDGAAHVCLP